MAARIAENVASPFTSVRTELPPRNGMPPSRVSAEHRGLPIASAAGPSVASVVSWGERGVCMRNISSSWRRAST